jgi:hypothetical protein
VQTQELHNDKKQKNNSCKTGIQQILQILPQAHSSQGNQVIQLIASKFAGQ